MNGLCKTAIVLVILVALEAFILPSSAQLVSSSDSSFGVSGSSFSSFSGFNGNIFSAFNNPPPPPGIFNGLGGWTGFGLGGIGGWGQGWCGGWSSAIVGLGCRPGLCRSGNFGCSPPIIPAPSVSAMAPTSEKSIANAPISTWNDQGISP